MRTDIPLGAVLGGGAGLLALAAGGYGLDFAGFAVVAMIVALLGLLASIVLYDSWAQDVR